MKIETFLRESPLFAITKAARILEANLNRALRDEEVSFLQGLVLAAIFFENAASVTPSQLAESFSTTRGNISHCLSSLEARGLVKRQVDPDDARMFRISIRPDGKRRALRLIRSFDAIQNRLERELGAKELCRTLSDIARIEQLSQRL
jgi:DNA-binding MarR family transcriptional regulator